MPVLSLAEAKSHLNLSANTDDVALGTVIESAETVIAHRCGPLEPTETRARVPGAGSALALPAFPAVSLTSVTPFGGSALPLADLYLDAAAGVVTYNTGGAFGAPFYDVVYEAGRASVPADLLYAVKELVRHLWSTSQRPAHALTVPVNPATYLLPYLVQSLIEPYTQPGFA